MGSFVHPNSRTVFKLCKIASSIILPAKTHVDPLTKSEKDVVFANGGPRFLLNAVQTCFQEHHTINKTCFKHIVT